MKYFSVCTILLICLMKYSTAVSSGHHIDIKEAPWMVWIAELKDGSNGEECGGAIIKDRAGSDGKKVSKFILTAAHCCVDDTKVDAKSPGSFILSLGSNKILGSDGQIITGVEKVHIHPEYSGPDTPHDIAILELSEEIVLDGKTKKAIKLADSDDKFQVGTEVMSAGWGQNPNGTAATLSEVTIKVRSYKKCYQENIHNPAIESEESLKEHQICALGGAPEYANVCKGDSGGPLYKKNGVQIGIVSFGQDCIKRAGKQYKMSVFTKISDNLDFIDDITG